MKTEAIQNLIKSGSSLVLGRDSGQTGEWERPTGKKERKGFGVPDWRGSQRLVTWKQGLWRDWFG